MHLKICEIWVMTSVALLGVAAQGSHALSTSSTQSSNALTLSPTSPSSPQSFVTADIAGASSFSGSSCDGLLGLGRGCPSVSSTTSNHPPVSNSLPVNSAWQLSQPSAYYTVAVYSAVADSQFSIATYVFSSVADSQLTITTTVKTTSTLTNVSRSRTGAIAGGAAGGAVGLAIIIISAILFMRRRAKVIDPSMAESPHRSIGTLGPRVSSSLRPSSITPSAIEGHVRSFGIDLDSHNSLAIQPQPRSSLILPPGRKEHFAMSTHATESNIINNPLTQATLQSPLISPAHYEEYRAGTDPVDNSRAQLASRPSSTVPSYGTEDDLSSGAESNAFNASLIRPSLQPFPGSTSRRTEYDPNASNHPLMQTRPRSSSAVQLSRTGNQVWHGSTTEPCPPSYSFSQPSFRPSSVAPSFRTAESDMPVGTTESDLPAYSSVASRSRRSSAAPSYSTRPNTIVEPNLVLDPVPVLPRMPSITLPYGDGRQVGWSSETI